MTPLSLSGVVSRDGLSALGALQGFTIIPANIDPDFSIGVSKLLFGDDPR
jgi:hypothetical protein